MNVKTKKIMVKSLKRCARCGGNHRSLTFKPFDVQFDVWTYWARCPQSGDPILMRIVKENAVEPTNTDSRRIFVPGHGEISVPIYWSASHIDQHVEKKFGQGCNWQGCENPFGKGISCDPRDET